MSKPKASKAVKKPVAKAAKKPVAKAAKKPVAKAAKAPAKEPKPKAAPKATTAAKPEAKEGGFTGFADASGKFFQALAKNQDREWFHAHKSDYEEGWAKPMGALMAEVRERIDAAYEDVDLAESKLFRIHRDVRFSADKSPYKTHVAGLISARPGRAVMDAPAALYFQVGTDGRFGAAGYYIMPKEALASYRAAVLDDKKGSEIDGILRALEKKGYTMEAGEVLKRVPPGVDPAHPRARLLQMKGLIASFPAFDPAILTSRAIADELVRRSIEVAPLVRWLVFATA